MSLTLLSILKHTQDHEDNQDVYQTENQEENKDDNQDEDQNNHNVDDQDNMLDYFDYFQL